MEQRWIIYGGIPALLLALFVWLFQDILAPFVVGLIVAYMLQPAVRALVARQFNPTLAVSVILGMFMLALIALLIVIAPIIVGEFLDFVDAIPGYIEKMQEAAEPYIADMRSLAGIHGDWKVVFGEHASSVAAPAADVGRGVLGGVLAGGQALAGFFSFWALMPVVAFFMMVEWPRAEKMFYDLLPRRAVKTVKEILKAIDEKLSSFVKGQLSVMIVLGLGYAIALTLAGLDYGFVIGLVAGALSIIPMFGSLIGLVLGVLVAWFQSGDWMFVLLIAGIFLAGQILEGNFITPKLVGESVGLHPLWVFFAIVAGGSLLGIVGMLIAVPVAAVVSVLLAFAIKAYKKTKFYKQKPKTHAKSKN